MSTQGSRPGRRVSVGAPVEGRTGRLLGGPTAAMSAALARNWWALALRGGLGVLFGIVALFSPVATLLVFALFFAAYLFVDGLFGLVAAVRAAGRGERWGWLVAEAVLNLVVGAVAAFYPFAAVSAFVLVAGAWSLITGAMMVAAGFKLDGDHGRWWLVLAGAASVLLGLALVIFPLLGAVVLTTWFAIYAIVFGVLLLVLAFKLRGRHREGGEGLAAGAA